VTTKIAQIKIYLRGNINGWENSVYSNLTWSWKIKYKNRTKAKLTISMQFHYSVCWRSSSPALAESLKLEINRRSYRIRFRYSGLYQIGGLFLVVFFIYIVSMLAMMSHRERSVGMVVLALSWRGRNSEMECLWRHYELSLAQQKRAHFCECSNWYEWSVSLRLSGLDRATIGSTHWNVQRSVWNVVRYCGAS